MFYLLTHIPEEIAHLKPKPAAEAAKAKGDRPVRKSKKVLADEEDSVEQGAKDAPLPDEGHQEGQDNAQASPKVSDSAATPFDAFGDTEQPRREVNAERRQGRVLHIDGFAHHTCVV